MRFPGRLIAAAAYLVGSHRQLDRCAPQRLARAGGAIMLLGIASGLIQIGLWDLTFRWTYRHFYNWVLPSAVCAAATCLVVYRRGALALIEAARPAWWARWPWLGALAGGWTVLLNYAVRWWNPDWPTQLPPALVWLWPRALYRAMLLAAVWGHWSALVLGQFHRPADRTDPATRALAEGASPLAGAAWLALPLAGSFVFLMFLPQALRFVPPAAALAAALGGGTLLVRLHGGLCREALLATNVLTQGGFLLAYAAVR